ncbi:hypothetical protein HZA99_01115 [Candidatus Woesearchaeota archaeon]|nr:hypothetical protein [Candidatus Woesearchaeota archaeon]
MILYFATGLCVFVILSLFFNILGIPLTYKIFFFASLFCPFHYVLTHYDKMNGQFFHSSSSSASFKEYICYALVLFAVLLLSFLYVSGAFAYPYLEDDDPWEHAVAVKYIADTGTYAQENGESISHYLEPYPPFYDVVLSMLYEINHKITSTLKTGNILLISLGFLFFFLFAKELFDFEVATIATLLLVALPSWISHFIWTHTLGLILIFPALTLTLKATKEKQWRIPAIIAVAAVLLAHPFVAIIFCVIFALFFLLDFVWDWKKTEQKKNIFLKQNPAREWIIVVFLGGILGSVYWLQQIARHGVNNILYSHTGGFGGVTSSGGTTAADLYINPAYSLKDLLVAPIITKIDQPTGFGVMICILTLCSLLFILFNWKKYWQQEKKEFVVVIWFFFMLLGLLSGHLPFSILTHRFWAYVSIPLVLLVALFLVEVHTLLLQKKILWSIAFFIIFIGIIGIPFTAVQAQEMNPDLALDKIILTIKQNPFFGVITAIDVFSSFQPKIISETMQWPPGVGWSSVQELNGYLWMQQNIPGKRVLSLCKEEKFLLGFGLETDFPNDAMNHWRETLAEKSVGDVVLYVRNYDYFSLEYSCVKTKSLSEEQLNALANALAAQFRVVYSNEEIVVYKDN